MMRDGSRRGRAAAWIGRSPLRIFRPVTAESRHRLRAPAVVRRSTSWWWPVRDGAQVGGSSTLAVAALSLPVLGFWLPFLGILLSCVLALNVVPGAGARLWGASRSRRRGVALLGFAALWLPAVLAFSGLFYAAFGGDGDYLLGSTAWLLLPLCAPEQIVAPTLVATAVYVTGAAISGALRRPWPWLLGGLLSALSYDAVILGFSIGSSC